MKNSNIEKYNIATDIGKIESLNRNITLNIDVWVNERNEIVDTEFSIYGIVGKNHNLDRAIDIFETYCEVMKYDFERYKEFKGFVNLRDAIRDYIKRRIRKILK